MVYTWCDKVSCKILKIISIRVISIVHCYVVFWSNIYQTYSDLNHQKHFLILYYNFSSQWFSATCQPHSTHHSKLQNLLSHGPGFLKNFQKHMKDINVRALPQWIPFMLWTTFLFSASYWDRHAHDASAASYVCTAHDEAALWSCSCTWHTGQFLICPQNNDSN